MKESFLDSKGFKILFFLLIIVLPVGFQQRNGQAKPPNGGHQEGKLGGRLGSQSKGSGENQDDADNKGDAAPNIPPGESMGGNHIHFFIRSHVRQHGIVKNIAGGIPHPGNDKQHQKRNPLPGKGHGQKPCDSQKQGGQKHLFLHALIIGDSAQYRGKHGQNQHGGGSDCPPHAGCLLRGKALPFR